MAKHSQDASCQYLAQNKGITSVLSNNQIVRRNVTFVKNSDLVCK